MMMTTDLNIDSILRELKEDEKNITIRYNNIPLKNFDELATGFFDESIIDAIQMHHEEDIINSIYHWLYGPYLITDTGAIFTKKAIINQEEINLAREGLEFTQKMIESGEIDEEDINPACLDLAEQIDNLYIYKICKRNNKKQRMKFYIYPNKVKRIKALGYKVYSEKSHFMRFNVKKNQYEHPMVHFTEIDVDAFAAMCRTKMPIRNGYRLDEKSGEEVAIKRGRPSKEIILKDANGNKMIFASKEELASMLGCSLSTVKRALKNKQAGDVVMLKKKENFILK